jgi:hypothetical protein
MSGDDGGGDGGWDSDFAVELSMGKDGCEKLPSV